MKQTFYNKGSILVIVLLIVCFGAGIFLIINSNKATQLKDGPVKIGVLLPLTGDAGSYGYPMLKGIELAKKETGKTDIELVVEDSKCENEATLNAFPKLIEKGVVAIIGESCSGPTLALIPGIEKEKIVLISPSATSPELSGSSKYFFRTVPSDNFQGVFGAKLLKDRGFSKLAIFYTDEEYGTAFSKVLEKEILKLKGSVVWNQSHDRNAKDFSKQVNEALAKKPDSVFIISNSPSSAAALIKQLKSNGFSGQIVGSDGVWSSTVIRESGKSSDGLLVIASFIGTTKFVEAHKMEYGVEPGPAAAQSYDAFKAIWMAIEKGAKNRIDIANNIASVKFDGAGGKIQFDSKGDIIGTYDVFKVENQKFVKVAE